MRVVRLKDNKSLNTLMLNKPNEAFQQNKIYTRAEALYNQFKTHLNKLNILEQEYFSINNIYISLMEWDSIINTKLIIRNNRIFNLISRPSFLLFSFSKLIEKGFNGINMSHITLTLGTIKRLSRDLLEGNYKLTHTKRVYINTYNGCKKAISIPSTRDNILQMALFLVLDSICDSTFLKNSYGFRKGIDCHTCLYDIKKNWKSTKWFISLDFKSAFDTIPNNFLISGLKEHIMDRRVIRIVIKFLKAGYIHMYGIKDLELDQRKGLSQCSILGPLFSNIAFHNIDKLISNYSEINNINYNHNTNVKKPYSNDFPISNSVIINNSCKDIRLLLKTYKDIYSNNYYELFDTSVKMYYVRYADEILIGVKGSKYIAFNILQNILHICESIIGMKYSISNILIKHHTVGILFLGYKLTCGKYHLEHDIVNNKKKIITNIRFSIPLKHILEKLKDKGFIMRSKKHTKVIHFVSRRMDKWLFLHEYDIIKRYNYLAINLINYYKGAVTYRPLIEILKLLKRSAALTLAHRKNKSTAKAGFNIYGYNLVVTNYNNTKYTSFSFDCLPNNESFIRISKRINNWFYIWTTLNLKGTIYKKNKKLSYSKSLNRSYYISSKKNNIFHNSKRSYSKKINIFFSRLKTKYFTKDFDMTHPIVNHTCIRRTVVTNKGKGFKLTPIMHHENDYVVNDLKGKHIIDDYIDPKGINHTIHKEGKTSTLSNKSFFIHEDYINSENPLKRVELNDKTSLYKRICTQNFTKHYNQQLDNETSFKDFYSNNELFEIDKDLEAISSEKNDTHRCITVLIDEILD